MVYKYKQIERHVAEDEVLNGETPGLRFAIHNERDDSDRENPNPRNELPSRPQRADNFPRRWILICNPR